MFTIRIKTIKQSEFALRSAEPGGQKRRNSRSDGQGFVHGTHQTWLLLDSKIVVPHGLYSGGIFSLNVGCSHPVRSVIEE